MKYCWKNGYAQAIGNTIITTIDIRAASFGIFASISEMCIRDRFVTIVGTVLGVMLTTLMGYVLSRPNYKLNGFLTMVVFIPMVCLLYTSPMRSECQNAADPL